MYVMAGVCGEEAPTRNGNVIIMSREAIIVIVTAKACGRQYSVYQLWPSWRNVAIWRMWHTRLSYV